MASLFCLAASQLLFHLGARAPSFILPGPAPYTGESILEQTILIFTRGVFVERFSCFHEFAIRRAMGVRGWYGAGSWAISDSRPPLLSARGQARGGLRREKGRDRLLYNVFPECLRLTSEFPILRFRFRFRRETCLPTQRFDGLPLRILPLKRIAKFIDATLL